MLPISEFHFAFCGIATVAATLGFACARRAALSFASPNESPKADVETGPPEERSLKRKLDHSDEHDVDAEEQLRPMKRNRTPPTDQRGPDEDSHQEWEFVVAPPPYEQVVGPHQPEEFVQDHNTPPNGNHHHIEQDVPPVRELTPPVHPEPLSQPEDKAAEPERCPTPQPPQVHLFLDEPDTPPPRPVTPPKPAPQAKIDSAKAFSAFSGSSSPFASYSTSSGVSPFALSGQVVRTTPAWRRDNEAESNVFGRAGSTNALAPAPNEAVSSTTTDSQTKGALGVPGEPQSLTKSSSHVTGEEDEDVEAELKGVKLFVKRGLKEFTDGMYGHVKILVQKSSPENSQGAEAETNSRARLLFRRDPLGQVSMNVGLHTTIRCHFDSAENILRVIRMEQVTTEEKDTKEDIVIYALKPGRAPKADFQSFAKTLCDHNGLQSRVETSSAASPSAGGAAS